MRDFSTVDMDFIVGALPFLHPQSCPEPAPKSSRKVRHLPTPPELTAQLSLTHFCEVHGPTSILCSQVLPFACAQCASHPLDPTWSSPTQSASSLAHQDRHEEAGDDDDADVATLASSSRASRTSAIQTSAIQTIEDHPCFLKTPHNRADTERPNRFGGEEGDTCASCSIALPDDVSRQLPPGAPGAPRADGKGHHGNPVLRSCEVTCSCGGGHAGDPDVELFSDLPRQSSSPESLLMSSSTASDASCHQHIRTYLSRRGPTNPANYALLRRSSIRTLSCELLPRGLSLGPLSFGDSATGYTIAFIFRLPDPMARGKRRSYALIALTGRDAGRAFRAAPLIWREFSRIATSIVSAAERYQEEEKRREERREEERAGTAGTVASGRHYTPIASFLTGRTVDPDGQPRRAGQIRARNLAEIVGDEYIFAKLHAWFVALLQQLGALFGGVPRSDDRAACSPGALAEDRMADATQARVSRRSLEGTPHPPSPIHHNRHSRHHRGESDLGLATLDVSSGPKPILIASRRPIAA